jgi:CHAT domain-containing protein/tetratricopeptide (TPR) repeat protein
MRTLPYLASCITFACLNLGAARSQDSAERKVYALSWKGGSYTLHSDVSPDDYLGGCIQQRLGSVASPNDQRAFCLKLMLLWGENLCTNFGKPLEPKDPAACILGRGYVKRSFELLTDDLDRRTGGDLAHETEVHRQLEIKVVWFPMEEYKDELVPPAIIYYLTAWKAAPAEPLTFQQFLAKFNAGEQLKQLLFDTPLTSSSSIDTVLAFYQSAFLFHQKKPPDVLGQGETASLPSLLGTPGLMTEIGYIRIPGDPGLVPVDGLPLDDLGRATTVLQKALQNKVLSDDQAKPRLEQIEKQRTAFQLQRDNWWIETLEKRGNHDAVAGYRSRIREIDYQMGDSAAAIREQEKICALLRAEGDREQAAEQAVGLAALLYQGKQWQRILDALATANQGLWDSVKFDDLRKAVALQIEARKQLHQPDDSQDWITKLTAFASDITTVPELADSSGDSPEQRVTKFKKWLAEPGHLEPLVAVTKIQMANVLQSLHQYGEAERVTSEVIDEFDRQGRKTKEFEALGVLLQIESQGGDVGRFYKTLDRYEKIGRQLHGDDWVQTDDGFEIARVLLDVGDVHRAQSVLSQEMDQERFEALRGSRFSKEGKEDIIADQDLLLQARIDLELGREDDAQLIVNSISRGGRAKDRVVVLQMAELDAALGDHENAIYKCDSLLKDSGNKPLDDLHLWVQINLVRGRSRLALGRDPGEITAKFAEFAPHFTEYKELDAGQGIEMEIFLADYFAWKRDDAQAIEWLKKGLSLADELGSTDQRIEIHRKLGEASSRNSDLDGAIREYRQSVSLVNSISTTIPSDLGKVGYRGERNKATALLVIALYEEYRRTGEVRLLAEMWRAVENGKSRALSESVLVGSRSNLDKVSLEEVRAALPPDGQLLEYYIPEGAADRIFRFIINPQGAAVDTLPVTASQLIAKVNALKAELEASADTYDERAFRSHCTELGRDLLPREWELFRATETRQLYIVPAGILYLFPFSLLADEKGSFLDENEHVQISYMPNATLILRPAPRFSDATHSLAFVNPGRDEEHAEFLDSDPALQQDLATVFRSWSNATLYWQRPFTARELLAQVRTADNVFIYAHGRFIPDDPMSSYIRVADDGGNSSMLSAADILTTQLGHGLWVLAACSTGSGRVRSGDEVLGLPRALLQSGASMVVIPLWDVHVSSSWRLMNLFYSNIAKGVPVSQALHSAASQLRAEHAVPFDWAPFILVGQHGYRN